MTQKLNNKGFTVIELVAAFAIMGVAIWASTHVFTTISNFGAKARHREKIISLESRLQSALYDLANYRPHKTAFQAGNNPSTMQLFFQESASQRNKIAELNVGSPTLIYFTQDLVECTSPTDPQCSYTIEAHWVSFAKLRTHVSFVSTKDMPLKTESREFEVPQDFYNDTKVLSCPNDGKTYLGIKHYDFSTIPPQIKCWELDTSTSCPANSYPAGIKPKALSVDTFEVECKVFPKIYCPQGYAPQKIFPIKTAGADLTNACISILASKIPLRFQHLNDLIRQNTPPAHGTHYGLKWISGKLCPDKYSLSPKAPYAGNAVNDFATLFNIQDGLNKTPCPSVSPSCSVNNELYYCDLCPVSSSAYKAGCKSSGRNFPTLPDTSSDPSCQDPKVFSVDAAQLNQFRNNFECKLNPSQEFANGQLGPF